jgi:hypothetical protein
VYGVAALDCALIRLSDFREFVPWLRNRAYRGGVPSVPEPDGVLARLCYSNASFDVTDVGWRLR